MDILNFGAHLFGNILTLGLSFFCWMKFENIKKKNITIFLNIFLISTIVTIISQYFPNPVKMINSYLILIFSCYLFVNKNFKKSILSVISSQIFLMIIESSFIIFILIFNFQNINNINSNSFIYLLLTSYVTLFGTILLKLKVQEKFYKLLINITNSIKDNETLIYSIIIIAIIVISTTESYMKLPTTFILITNIIMATVFITIVITSSINKANYNKISKKYQTSISSLKEYEVMIDKFGVYTHENKNEINTIRNMIKDNIDKDEIIKHIDVLLKNKIKDNAKIMQKTSKIPSGGLRATIYSKLCLMDKLKIKYILNISREVKTTDLINLDEDLTLKICNILGVFLDNAIEAVKELKKKEISIEMYIIDKWLCIDVTNNFKGNLDLSKISEVKYTTKGKGHGYGLSLVQEILNEEPKKLKNEKSINRDTFTQTLKIKM